MEHEPSWAFGRGLSVANGLPDPGAYEDLEDGAKVEKRKAELEAQTRMMALFDNELVKLQAQVDTLRMWLHTYYRKPLPKDNQGGLKKID